MTAPETENQEEKQEPQKCSRCGKVVFVFAQGDARAPRLSMDEECSCEPEGIRLLDRLMEEDGSDISKTVQIPADQEEHSKIPEDMTGKLRKLKLTHDGITFSHSESGKLNPNDIGLKDGATIGGVYRIIKRIGSGAMGDVYLAEHVMLGTKCALKVIPPAHVSQVSWQRFQMEAKAIATLDHANLVKVSDLGVHEGCLPFYAMQYLEGETLEDVLAGQRKLPLKTVLEIFIPLCDGLEYAHKHNVVHRDLKPANIMLLAGPIGKDSIKLLDFGLAKLTEQDKAKKGLTSAGEIFGSPPYMSPEQCRGDEIDSRSDIYSLGCTLFECLTGRPPFDSTLFTTLLYNHQKTPAPTLASIMGPKHFPDTMEVVMERLLRKDALERYQTMLEVRRDLELISCGAELPEPVIPQTLSGIMDMRGSQSKLSPVDLRSSQSKMQVADLHNSQSKIQSADLHNSQSKMQAADLHNSQSKMQAADMRSSQSKMPAADQRSSQSKMPAADQNSSQSKMSAIEQRNSHIRMPAASMRNSATRMPAVSANQEDLAQSEVVAIRSVYDDPDVWVIRKPPKIVMFLVGLMLVGLTGAYWYYSQHQEARQPVRPVLSMDSLPLSFKETEPFSATVDEGGKRLRRFNFPLDVNLGQIHSAANLVVVPAMGQIQFAEADPVYFVPDGVVTRYPGYLKRFRPGDIFALTIPNVANCDTLIRAGSAIPQVQKLTIHRCQSVTRAGLECIKSYSNLEDLNCTYNKIDVGCMANIPGLHALKSLHLSGEKNVDPVIKRLAGSDALQELHLNDCSMGIDTLSTIATLPNLTTLSLNSDNLTDGDLTSLSKCPKLHFLSILNTPLTKETTNILKSFPSLKSVHILGKVESKEAPDSQLIELRKALPTLQVR